MTAEEILSIHTDTFNRALKEQDYIALEGLYADDYMLVRPDGSVLSPNLQDGCPSPENHPTASAHAFLELFPFCMTAVGIWHSPQCVH